MGIIAFCAKWTFLTFVPEPAYDRLVLMRVWSRQSFRSCCLLWVASLVFQLRRYFYSARRITWNLLLRNVNLVHVLFLIRAIMTNCAFSRKLWSFLFSWVRATPTTFQIIRTCASALFYTVFFTTKLDLISQFTTIPIKLITI